MRKKRFRHVSIQEETYNAERQAQDLQNLKKSALGGLKQLGCGCLGVLVLIFFLIIVGSLLSSFLILL